MALAAADRREERKVKDQYLAECLICLKAYMNHDFGLENVMNHQVCVCA